MQLNELPIDKTWTLFLDRDGVINLHYPNDYVKTWDEFYFLEGVLDALNSLSEVFKRILVVTNQQGVGKELMSKDDLQFIHDEMLREVRKYGGRLHAIYAATELVANDTQQMRKPGIGMALKAKKDFVDIDFVKSIMVGDSITDMQFGKNAGMITVFIGDTAKVKEMDKQYVDHFCDSLLHFAGLVSSSGK
ncbi:MAG TPA: HAD-IIIA family hydrolase [Chitinophagales bacterium]|nr:HAD-IIIA family hydrolase [Chitinophagales bacterium]